MFFVKTPWWLKKVYGNYTWNIPVREKILYLTFDDGPHPVATPFVLQELKKNDAKATFFCIGKNVNTHPEIYNNIIAEGHAIGNHTYDHLNGWKTDNDLYLANVGKASKCIDSPLFRPPYGRIKKEQGRQLIQQGYSIIMWDVLSGDFDQTLSSEACFKNVARNAVSGSIIVFHDSEKALSNVKCVLPRLLGHLGQQGYKFQSIKNLGTMDAKIKRA